MSHLMVRCTTIWALLFAGVLIGQLLGPVPPARSADSPPRLSLPVLCSIAEDCHVQFFVDVDPGPAARDYRCGSLSYDGHKGVDFRTPDLVAMERGVTVVAAADGIVRAIRDGEPDITDRARGAEAERLAGNAVVLTHGGSWETQYSHLKNGSVAVAPGDHVTAGQTLGMIGLSGNTNYPHLDFSVRHDGQVIDPFTGASSSDGCGIVGEPLWREQAMSTLGYRPSGLLIAGFASSVPAKNAVRAGAHRSTSLDAHAAALVFWTDVFGIQSGDVEEFRIVAPDGKIIVEHRARLNDNAHQRFMFAGRKTPAGGWAPGTYVGEYRLLRDGVEPAIHVKRMIEVR